jgi:hypothetical protein
MVGVSLVSLEFSHLQILKSSHPHPPAGGQIITSSHPQIFKLSHLFPITPSLNHVMHLSPSALLLALCTLLLRIPAKFHQKGFNEII